MQLKSSNHYSHNVFTQVASPVIVLLQTQLQCLKKETKMILQIIVPILLRQPVVR